MQSQGRKRQLSSLPSVNAASASNPVRYTGSQTPRQVSRRVMLLSSNVQEQRFYRSSSGYSYDASTFSVVPINIDSASTDQVDNSSQNDAP